MKVNIREQIDISDVQRVALARRLDGPTARKRQATREEIKTFVWTYGARWDDALGVAEPTDETKLTLEDLL